MKRWLQHSAAVICFGGSLMLGATLTGGCDNCELLVCEEILDLDDGVYRFMSGASPSWALEVGEVTLSETTMTIDYTDLEGQERVAVWSIEPLL